MLLGNNFYFAGDVIANVEQGYKKFNNVEVVENF